jgi:hypothetical protein
MTAALGKAAGTGQHRKAKDSPPVAARRACSFDYRLELNAERRS